MACTLVAILFAGAVSAGELPDDLKGKIGLVHGNHEYVVENPGGVKYIDEFGNEGVILYKKECIVQHGGELHPLVVVDHALTRYPLLAILYQPPLNAKQGKDSRGFTYCPSGTVIFWGIRTFRKGPVALYEEREKTRELLHGVLPKPTS